MIPRAYITEWGKHVPWKTNEQIEQDLVISRALVELFSDDYITEKLAFRGGTALHKLYLNPQPRYSEDIDLVQIVAEPIGSTIDKIRNRLSFLGVPKRKQKDRNTTLIYRFESEIPPVVPLKLKVEINCREHSTIQGFKKVRYSVESSWFTDKCKIITYSLEELLGMKLRALYQRKKGRDLYDIYKAYLINPEIIIPSIVDIYKEYMKNEKGGIPSKKLFLMNIDKKINDAEFLGDTTSLIRPEESYEPEKAYEYLKHEIIELM